MHGRKQKRKVDLRAINKELNNYAHDRMQTCYNIVKNSKDGNKNLNFSQSFWLNFQPQLISIVFINLVSNRVNIVCHINSRMAITFFAFHLSHVRENSSYSHGNISRYSKKNFPYTIKVFFCKGNLRAVRVERERLAETSK